MQTRVVLFIGVVCFLPFLQISVSANEWKGKWMEKMKKCGDVEINTNEAFKGQEECKANSTIRTESRRRRSPGEGKTKKKWGMGKDMCVAVCQLKIQGVLDKNGKFSESGCEKHVKNVYPEKFQTTAAAEMKKCGVENSSSFSMDNKCAGYKKFTKCAKRAHNKICKTDKGAKGKNKTFSQKSIKEEEEDDE